MTNIVPMARFFNTTGPCYPERHYFLAPESRLRKSSLERYIRDQMYWVLHAPRQTGKTTFLQTWMREINASGEAIACYVSVERCQGIPEVEKAHPGVCSAIRHYAKDFEAPVPDPRPQTSRGPVRRGGHPRRPGHDLLPAPVAGWLCQPWHRQVPGLSGPY